MQNGCLAAAVHLHTTLVRLRATSHGGTSQTQSSKLGQTACWHLSVVLPGLSLSCSCCQSMLCSTFVESADQCMCSSVCHLDRQLPCKPGAYCNAVVPLLHELKTRELWLSLLLAMSPFVRSSHTSPAMLLCTYFSPQGGNRGPRILQMGVQHLQVYKLKCQAFKKHRHQSAIVCDAVASLSE